MQNLKGSRALPAMLVVGLLCVAMVSMAAAQRAGAPRESRLADQLRIGLEIPNLLIHAQSSDGGAQFTVPVPTFLTEVLVDRHASAKADGVVTIQRHYFAEGFEFDVSMRVTPPAMAAADATANELVIASHFSQSDKAKAATLAAGTTVAVSNLRAPRDVNIISIEGGINIRTGPIRVGF